jgi:DNA polymerase-3 subunit beta
MHTRILQSNFKRALDMVGGAVARRPSLPVLTHILINAADGAITLAGTDLEVHIRAKVQGQTVGAGSYTVPYRLLSDFVGALPDEAVNLQVDEAGEAVSIECERNKAHINGIPAEEFPLWNDRIYRDGPIATFDPPRLKAALESVVYAAATDESRPILTGVYFVFNDGKLSLAAADGFRLAVREMTLAVNMAKPEEAVSVIVPARAVEDLLKLLPDEGNPVAVYVDDDTRAVGFRLTLDPTVGGIAEVEMASSLIEGNFVNYSQIIPTSHSTRVVADCATFATALKRAQIFARYEASLVHLEVVPDEGKVRFHAESAEMGEHNGEIEAQVEGEPVHIAFNTVFLRDAIASMPESEFVMEFAGKARPAALFPKVDDKSQVGVIMPMHVRDAG